MTSQRMIDLIRLRTLQRNISEALKEIEEITERSFKNEADQILFSNKKVN